MKYIMNINYTVLARIVLRYIAGAGLLGSLLLGEQLAADPDIVLATSAALGAIVEYFYAQAKRKGGAT
jgi:hypothetical protein